MWSNLSVHRYKYSESQIPFYVCTRLGSFACVIRVTIHETHLKHELHAEYKNRIKTCEPNETEKKDETEHNRTGEKLNSVNCQCVRDMYSYLCINVLYMLFISAPLFLSLSKCAFVWTSVLEWV